MYSPVLAIYSYTYVFDTDFKRKGEQHMTKNLYEQLGLVTFAANTMDWFYLFIDSNLDLKGQHIA